MKILVTGASGFVGGALTASLLREGHEVAGLYRSSPPHPRLAALRSEGAELLQGDLSRGVTIPEGTEGVIHAAALTSDWGSRELFERINHTGAVNVAVAARRAGCCRFLYVSSVAVHGFGGHDGSTTEAGPYYALRSPYCLTKLKAENSLLAMNSRSFEVVVTRPANVYGPGDTTTHYKILDALERGIMGYIAGGARLTSPVYIDDVVRGALLAFERGAAGEVYNLVPTEPVSWRTLTERLAAASGARKPRLSIAAPLALFLGVTMEAVFKRLGAKTAPPLTRYRVEQLIRDYAFSGVKAEEQLGFRADTPLDEGIRKMVTAYRQKREGERV